MAEPARPFTPETLAEHWSCSAQHVRDLVRAGKLPAFRVGRLIRIRREDVLAFEQPETKGAPTEPPPPPELPFVPPGIRKR